MRFKILIALFFISFAASAQWQKPNNSYGTIANAQAVGRIFFFPTGSGAPGTLSLPDSAINMFAMYGDSTNGKIYFYNPKTKAWSVIAGGGTITPDSTYLALGIKNDTSLNPGHPTLIIDSSYIRDTLLRVKGGTTGQVLKKNSSTNYDYSWKDESATGGSIHEVTQEYTGSSSVTITDSTTWLIINPAAKLTSLTVTLPANPTDGKTIDINFGGTINTKAATVVTSFLLVANTGQQLVGTGTYGEVVTEDHIRYRFNSSHSKWFRN